MELISGLSLLYLYELRGRGVSILKEILDKIRALSIVIDIEPRICEI